MGRIRTIKPEFFRHLDLFKAEKESGLPLRVAFAGLWTVADREGRFRWQPEVLKLDILPFDEVDFSRVLDALLTRGFIVKYGIRGKDYGLVPTFKEHQIINNREKESTLPAHDESYENSSSSTREPRVIDASPTPLKQDQGEREREREQELKDIPSLTLGDCARARVLRDATKTCEKIPDPAPEPEPEPLTDPILQTNPDPEPPPLPATRKREKSCPYQEIVEVYHEICPMLPRVTSWNGEGKKSMGARWKEDKARQSLAWWEGYFKRVRDSNFLTGKIKDFSANLVWLVGRKNMDKVINGAYDNRKTAVIPERLRNNLMAGIEFLEED